jgi:hypothetical protein
VSNLKIYKQAYKTQNNNARLVSIHKNLNKLILYYVNAWKKPWPNITFRILVTNSNQLWQARKTKTSIWKLEIMTPLGNINLNKIFEKIAHMFMKQNYGHAFQLVKRVFCFDRY